MFMANIVAEAAGIVGVVCGVPDGRDAQVARRV